MVSVHKHFSVSDYSKNSVNNLHKWKLDLSQTLNSSVIKQSEKETLMDLGKENEL